jgi:hypothetical protein
MRDHVAGAQGEECGPTQVQIHPQSVGPLGRRPGPRNSQIDQRESENQSRGPHHQQAKDRERTEDAEKIFSAFTAQLVGDGPPGPPGDNEIEAAQPEIAGNTPRQYHRLERVLENKRDEPDADSCDQ